MGGSGSAVPLIECDTQREWRCPECHLLLFKGKVEPGSVIEVPCTRCTKKLRDAAIKLYGDRRPATPLVLRRFGFV